MIHPKSVSNFSFNYNKKADDEDKTVIFDKVDDNN